MLTNIDTVRQQFVRNGGDAANLAVKTIDALPPYVYGVLECEVAHLRIIVGAGDQNNLNMVCRWFADGGWDWLPAVGWWVKSGFAPVELRTLD